MLKVPCFFMCILVDRDSIIWQDPRSRKSGILISNIMFTKFLDALTMSRLNDLKMELCAASPSRGIVIDQASWGCGEYCSGVCGGDCEGGCSGTCSGGCLDSAR